MQASKIMHGLRGMGQMMFTKYIIVVHDERRRGTRPAKSSSAFG
jgi:3-polyprenyl-4-hydroxybenzoate decarboxylase